MSKSEMDRSRAEAKKKAAASGAEFVQVGNRLFHRSALGLSSPAKRATVEPPSLYEHVKKKMAATSAETAYYGEVAYSRAGMGLPPAARAPSRPRQEMRRTATKAPRPKAGNAGARKAARSAHSSRKAAFGHLAAPIEQTTPEEPAGTGVPNPAKVAAGIIRAGEKRRGEINPSSGMRGHDQAKPSGLAGRIIRAGEKRRGER